jgi:CRISPR/Cas system-associated exonuclease Cas4 (RecB family)
MERGTRAHKMLIEYNEGRLNEKKITEDALLKYLENFKKIQNKYKLGVPSRSDLKLNGMIGGIKVQGEMDAAYSMMINNQERFLVIDYKSGSSKTAKIKRLQNKTPEKVLGPYIFELQVYAYLFKGATGSDIRRYGIMFLGDGEFFHLPVDPEYKILFENVEKIVSIVKEAKYEPIPSSMCGTCGVNLYCKSYIKGVFPEEESE